MSPLSQSVREPSPIRGAISRHRSRSAAGKRDGKSDENFPTKISNYFNLKFCQTHGRVGHRRRWPMIADLFEVNCMHGIFVAFFAPQSPCRLLCDKLEMKREIKETFH